MRRFPAALVALSIACVVFGARPRAQGISSPDAYRVRQMLRDAYEAVRMNYYDPALHGVDWDTRYRDFGGRVAALPSIDAGLMLVAEFVDGLRDSHTYFLPPGRASAVEYGYHLDVIGDAVFITHVKPGSDAALKVHVGERVLSINGNPVDRSTFRRLEHVLFQLSPQVSTTLALHGPSGGERTVVVASKLTPKGAIRYLTNGNDVGDVIREQESAETARRSVFANRGDALIWKLPSFLQTPEDIDHAIGEAARYTSLILDLRGNAGGRVDAMARLVGDLFDHDVTIATRTTRTGRDSIVAHTSGARAFRGKLVVLIDAGSASSSEILARTIQLEHRGIVIGDRSAGAVMETLMHPFAPGGNIPMAYAFAVTAADLTMSDGARLEDAGVAPDEWIVPTAADLVAGHDRVLARAAALVGVDLTPAAAGALFPFEWGAS